MENSGNTTRSAIETNQLSTGYRTNHVENILFNNLNLSLQTGKLTCFMGPNGIGKSTLIRTLAGLQKPLAGEIHYFPEEKKKEAPLSQKIALVLTDRISMPNMGVYELISFGRYPYLDWNIKLSKADTMIIQQAIQQVHIEHLVDKRLYELSDGQLQMVMIARALAQDTPIILLDEPTAHLDLNNRVQMMNLLRKLSRILNKTILVATHELDLALQTADEIWLTRRDKNIITGIPEDLILQDVFDEIFQFKGFDLKTGRVDHEVHRNISIKLIGNGHEFLWTKNALERNGYCISTDQPDFVLTISNQKNTYAWQLNEHQSFSSLQDVLAYLGSESKK
ncbi:MAG TPA: ABC transporter ATP-binding protein [Chryseolinea sp.]|nr:ABC transporter ATP-binding protein [Chryseolinea sp.]HPM31876.1 ABC transporter ATP-binding protein [Chryseolinea sp.]